MTALVTVLADIEYAVRYQIAGEHQRIDPVGSRQDAADLIHELWLRHGITGERIGRMVGPWEQM
jgi:hypothetical protein